MGLFGWFSSKNRKNKDNAADYESTLSSDGRKDGKRPVRLSSQADRINYIKENCELVAESDRQIQEAKVEYQAVTSYLTDMQKIDLIPFEQRERIDDSARKIINLMKERGKYHDKEPLISDRQYHLFESYELQIPKEMPSIRDSENYQETIRKDMEHLENEKENLAEEQDEIVSKQSFLRGIAITTCVMIVLLFGVFALLGTYSEADVTLPFLLTVLMGMASAIYLFMEARKNTRDSQFVQMKQKRQVMLMNKVKIKSVNNRNYLDYTYSKYMVDSYDQLKKMWDEYLKLKDEERRYQNNTELLTYYQSELIHELKKFAIADAEIWIYQPSAILDNKEMVEVRHRLIVRRQKLRERIDINNRQKEEAIKSIQSVIRTYPECEEEASKLLRRYRIDIMEGLDERL